MNKILIFLLELGIVVTATMAGAAATEMVYAPINPSFGGNPNHGPVLLSAAQAQNGYKDPAINVAAELTPLQQFNQNLQRSVLSRLSAAATTGLIGSSGQLIPGVVDTGNYHIVISDLGSGILQVSTTDKTTGENVMFQVNGK